MFNYLRHRRFVADEASRLVTSLEAMAATSRRRPSPAQAEQALEQTAAAVADRGLGWVGQSVLANQVKWALADRGFPADWVNDMTERLVLACAGAAAQNLAGSRRPCLLTRRNQRHR